MKGRGLANTAPWCRLEAASGVNFCCGMGVFYPRPASLTQLERSAEISGMSQSAILCRLGPFRQVSAKLEAAIGSEEWLPSWRHRNHRRNQLVTDPVERFAQAQSEQNLAILRDSEFG